jgi:hypothetical protein
MLNRSFALPINAGFFLYSFCVNIENKIPKSVVVPVKCVVYDAAGIIILRTTVTATDMQLPLPKRSHGVYIVKLNGTAYKVK